MAATQRPSVDVIPGSLRANFSMCWALRCRDKRSTGTILGEGVEVDSSTIPPNQQGTGYLLAEEGDPVRMRAYHVPDDQLRVLVEAAGARVSGVPEAPEASPTGKGSWQSPGSPVGSPSETSPGTPVEKTEKAPKLSREELAAAVAMHLNAEPVSQGELARLVGLSSSSGSLRRALALLADRGWAVREAGGWRATTQEETRDTPSWGEGEAA